MKYSSVYSCFFVLSFLFSCCASSNEIPNELYKKIIFFIGLSDNEEGDLSQDLVNLSLASLRWHNLFTGDISFIDYLVANLYKDFQINGYLCSLLPRLNNGIFGDWKNFYHRLEQSKINFNDLDESLLPFALYYSFCTKDKLTIFDCPQIEQNQNLYRLMIDRFGKTPLIYAVIFEDYDLVGQLLQHGAKFSWVDNRGMSAFTYARLLNNQDIKEILIFRGVDEDKENDLWRNCVLNIADVLYPLFPNFGSKKTKKEKETFIQVSLDSDFHVKDALEELSTKIIFVCTLSSIWQHNCVPFFGEYS